MGIETAVILGSLAAGAAKAATAAAVVGGAAFAAGKAIKGGSKDKGEAPGVKPLPEPPTKENAALKAEKISRQRRQNQTRTIFTDPLGSAGQADVVKKTLLGS